MEEANILGTEKISTLLRKFSVPAIIGMVINALYNVVDRIFIGNSSLGANGIAGITIAFPLMIIIIALGALFGVGGEVLFSIRLGEGKEEKAKETIGNSFVLLVVSGLLLMLFAQIFMDPLLRMFGASDVVLPYAKEYLVIIFSGAVLQVVSMGLNSFLRADGQPKLAMITMFVGAGTNIVLDPIFIFVFNMGMSGAALATIISQAVSFTWILAYFLSKKTKHRIRLKYMRLKWEVSSRIISLGLPGFFMQLATSLLNAVLNKSLLTYGGDLAVSGMGDC